MRSTVGLRRRTSAAIVCAGVIMAVAVANPASGAARAHSAAKTLTPVTFGVPPNIVTGTAYLADAWGYFKQYGIAPSFVTAPSGTLLTQAMIGGSINFATSSFYIPMQVAEKGQALQLVVGGYDSQATAVMVPTASSIATNAPTRTVLTALQGKRIGVAALGSAQQTTFQAMLVENGLPSNYVTFIPVGVGATAVAAFSAGEIDALFSSDPAIQILTGNHTAKIVIDQRPPKNQGGPIAKVPSVGTFATKAYIAANPQVTAGVVKALSLALQRAHKYPAQAAKALETFPTYTATNSNEIILESCEGDASGFSPLITPKQILTTSAVLEAGGVLTQLHTYQQVVAAQYAKDWTIPLPGSKPTKKKG